jgi:acetyl esterase/lipase
MSGSFVPTLAMKDPLMRCSKRLKAALDHLGTPCVLHVSPGEIHGYDAMVWRPEARAKWRAVHAFLEEHLKHARSTEAHAHGARATG